MEAIGSIADWAKLRYGSGVGYGYGHGYGSGRGYGYGIGYGYGYGYGYGHGHGYGPVLEASVFDDRIKITAQRLQALRACTNGIKAFDQVFPDGAVYPDDIAKAREAGLDIEWILTIGLPTTEDI